FVPIGRTSEEVVEDVNLADLSESKADSDRNPLSIPDSAVPAALAETKIARSGAGGSAQPAASSAGAVTPRPVVTTIARRAPSPRPAPPATTAPDATDSASNSPANEPTDRTDLPELSADGNQGSVERSPTSPTENNSPLSADDLIASANAELPASLQAMAAEIAAALTYREAGTSEAVAQQKRDAWEAKIRTQANIGPIENIAPQAAGLTRISYPIESAEAAEVLSYSACLEKDPHNAEVGVWFDSRGNVVDDPELIRSTGYGALNEKILATFADVDHFSNLSAALTLEDRRSKAYTFEVAVDYKADACVSLEKLQPASESSGGE
ncbi:MAG: hypothetical protein WBB01_23225, partial [Phormidesmis sp.]